MEGFLQQLTGKVIAGLTTFVIIQFILFLFFIYNNLKKLVSKMEDFNAKLSTIKTDTQDMHTMLNKPDAHGFGVKNTERYMREMIEEIRKLNDHIIRLLTMIERNGLRR